jgi:Domain of unknown function (DUF892)
MPVSTRRTNLRVSKDISKLHRLERASRDRLAAGYGALGRNGGVATALGVHLNSEANMSKETKQLDDLFHEGLKDIYFVEKTILTALPKMAKAAERP